MLALAQRVAPRRVGLRYASNAAALLNQTADVYNSFATKAAKSYEESKAVVDASLNGDLNNSKVVVFLEGTADAPKSEASLNAVKVLTEAQVAPFLCVDVLQHPAILGYAMSKSNAKRAPFVFVNGSFYGDHEGLMTKHQSGELQKSIGNSSRSTGVFAGELPVASY
mmetsp:Transcript_26883/g.59478  ORF Transcript_26883/g.59478 Transcript_26883/m.59478 type:complete len:167 (-) Transcript_26883:69-569(-)|eukprot:CAMPEP_0204268916 /NCGR_PEP_ID=MMETSP0468-20130131/15088_1 /ASSEMBLY_ACC=CAM_ASM_000383 /TAXON_ID=2969 /ORGANISM="Oxyrrhis marina" /LENGTH=166 /DNA_ID=CAMNT_0051244239 /DNA_START=53 /DNA_END=553 /DNA_ORIENTATION=+